MTRHLTVEQALRIARAAVGGPIDVRDIGLLDSALHRPRASVLGQDAYPDLLAKAAALLHSLAGNHPLVDGNKRLAWLATYVFLAKNGVELDPDDDAAYDFVDRCRCGTASTTSPRSRTRSPRGRPRPAPSPRTSSGSRASSPIRSNSRPRPLPPALTAGYLVLIRPKYGPRERFAPPRHHQPKQKAAICGGFARALCRTRTGDPFLTMEVLYQLS